MSSLTFNKSDLERDDDRWCMSSHGHSEIFMTSMISSLDEKVLSKMSWMLGVSIAHTGDVYRSYSSNGEGFGSNSTKTFWISWYDIYMVDKGILLLVSSSFSECISFPSLVWTWFSFTVVPSNEVESIVVVDLIKTVNGKLTFDVMVKMEQFEG